LLITVDDQDSVCGYETKQNCHRGAGILHRAFSIFIFNGKKELLLQKRSSLKPLWPLYWSNSACSHPRKGEKCATAAHRRLKEELGIETSLKFLFKFEYQARFETQGSEHELCYVYIGRSDETVEVDPKEVDEHRYIAIDILNNQMRENPEIFTPWFKLEWDMIKNSHMDAILNL